MRGDVLSGAVTITGPGADVLTINAGRDGDGLFNNNGFRIFQISGAPSSPIDVGISGLTLTGGDTAGGAGAIASGNANVTLFQVTIDGNGATNSGAISHGGAGTFVIDSSTVSNNRSTAANGGAISNSGEMVIRNSTISGNTAGGTGQGGAILNFGPGGRVADLTILNSTLSGNTANNGGDSIAINSGYSSAVARIDNSIIANPILLSNLGTVSGNFNLLSTNGAAIGGGNDVRTTTFGLGPLADNGGPTLTHALLPTSPAIDAGSKLPDRGDRYRSLPPPRRAPRRAGPEPRPGRRRRRAPFRALAPG